MSFPEIVVLTLSERRKSDRRRMANLLADRARQTGATVAVEPEGSVPYAARRTRVHMALNGFAASVDFDGESVQPDIFVIPWHAEDIGSDERLLSAAFGSAAGGQVNSFHWHKCTAVAYGFDDLETKVEAALKMLADGSAFQNTAV